jgi:hypothetical protein
MAVLLTIRGATGAGSVAGGNRCAFIGITNFSSFAKSPAALTNETIFTSPEIMAPIDWDELIVSWNVPRGVHLKVEARAVYPSHATRYYTMGLWSDDPARFPRESVRRQRDEDGSVKMDTLVLSNATRKVQLRITAGGAGDQRMLKFVGLSFCNSAVPATALAPNRAAWGKVLEVPERRQAEYEGGGGWCSPTSLSMVLAYWSEQLHRPELNHTVPETADGFTDKGDVVANNPGVSVRRNVRARQVYVREKVANAWKKSKNAVYLIYPETARIPPDRLGHWAGVE